MKSMSSKAIKMVEHFRTGGRQNGKSKKTTPRPNQSLSRRISLKGECDFDQGYWVDESAPKENSR